MGQSKSVKLALIAWVCIACGGGGDDEGSGPAGKAGGSPGERADAAPDATTMGGDGGPQGDAAPPAADAVAPVSDSTTPGGDAAPPVADAAPPVADAALPAVDAALPAVDAALPAADAAIAPADAALPAADASPPEADAALLAADAALPAVDAGIVVQATCGNGVLEGREGCDDGNSADEDLCSDSCRVESCGDGVAQLALGERCDDANAAPGDGCSAFCAFEPFAPLDAIPVAGADASCELGTAGDGRNIVMDDGGRAYIGLRCGGRPTLAWTSNRGLTWSRLTLDDAAAEDLVLAAGAVGEVAALYRTAGGEIVLARPARGVQSVASQEVLARGVADGMTLGAAMWRRDVTAVLSDGVTVRELRRAEGRAPETIERPAVGVLTDLVFDRPTRGWLSAEQGATTALRLSRPGRATVDLSAQVPDGTRRFGFGAQRVFFARRDGVVVRPLHLSQLGVEVPFDTPVDTREMRMHGGDGGVVYVAGRTLDDAQAIAVQAYDVATGAFGVAAILPQVGDAFDFAPLPNDQGALVAWQSGGGVFASLIELERAAERLVGGGLGGGGVVGVGSRIECGTCGGRQLGAVEARNDPKAWSWDAVPLDGESNGGWNPSAARAFGNVAAHANRHGLMASGWSMSAMDGQAEVVTPSLNGGQGTINITFDGNHGRALTVWHNGRYGPCFGGFGGVTSTSVGGGAVEFHTSQDGVLDVVPLTQVLLNSMPPVNTIALDFQWALHRDTPSGPILAAGQTVYRYSFVTTHWMTYIDAQGVEQRVDEADVAFPIAMPADDYVLVANVDVESFSVASLFCDDESHLAHAWSSAIGLIPSAPFFAGFAGEQFTPDDAVVEWTGLVGADVLTGWQEGDGEVREWSGMVGALDRAEAIEVSSGPRPFDNVNDAP